MRQCCCYSRVQTLSSAPGGAAWGRNLISSLLGPPTRGLHTCPAVCSVSEPWEMKVNPSFPHGERGHYSPLSTPRSTAVVTSKAGYSRGINYLVQNPSSLRLPKGTATLCLGKSCRTTAGRLQHWALPAPVAGEKAREICFWSRGASNAGWLRSGIKSQQGRELQCTAGCSPPGQMLKVVLSRTWKYWNKEQTMQRAHLLQHTEKWSFFKKSV